MTNIVYVKSLANDDWVESRSFGSTSEKIAELAVVFTDFFDSSEWAYALDYEQATYTLSENPRKNDYRKVHYS